MNNWKLLKTEVLHKDFWNTVNKNTYELPNGKQIKDYIMLHNRPVAMIFAITNEQKIVLIKEYKPGSGKVVTQLPAGYVDDKETPEEAAKRELAEETGHTAKKFVKLGTLFSSSGKMTATVTCFMAEHAKKEQAQKLDEHEEVDVFTASLDEAQKMVETGIIDSGDSAAFILMGINKLKSK